MNDHNLDDLIIDNIEPKSSKAKGILTIVALLLVVFILGIILMSVDFSDSKSDKNKLEENDTEMVSPELTLENVSNIKKPEAEPKLNEIIEEKLNKPVTPPKASEETIESLQESAKPKIDTPKVIEKPVVPEKVVSEKVPDSKKVPETKKVEITKEFTQTPTQTEVKPVVKEEKTITIAPVPKEVKKTAAVSSGPTFYIQVGSYTNLPSQKFLSRINNNGFQYTVKTVGKSKKVLIGPYQDRSTVDAAIVRVRDLITKSAFVVKK